MAAIAARRQDAIEASGADDLDQNFTSVRGHLECPEESMEDQVHGAPLLVRAVQPRAGGDDPWLRVAQSTADVDGIPARKDGMLDHRHV
jgi:hypothetical protein